MQLEEAIRAWIRAGKPVPPHRPEPVAAEPEPATPQEPTLWERWRNGDDVDERFLSGRWRMRRW